MPYSGTNRSLANLHDNRKPLQYPCPTLNVGWRVLAPSNTFLLQAHLLCPHSVNTPSFHARALCHETTPLLAIAFPSQRPPDTTTYAPRTRPSHALYRTRLPRNLQAEVCRMLAELETMLRNAMKPTHSRRTRYASFNSMGDSSCFNAKFSLPREDASDINAQARGVLATVGAGIQTVLGLRALAGACEIFDVSRHTAWHSRRAAIYLVGSGSRSGHARAEPLRLQARAGPRSGAQNGRTRDAPWEDQERRDVETPRCTSGRACSAGAASCRTTDAWLAGGIGVVVLEGAPFRANSCGGNRRRVPHRGGIESRAGVREYESWPSKWGLAGEELRRGAGLGAVHQAALGWLINDDDEGRGRRLTGLWQEAPRTAREGGSAGRTYICVEGRNSSLTHSSRTSSGSSSSSAAASLGPSALASSAGAGFSAGHRRAWWEERRDESANSRHFG
ncbi:hypothetical protein DFH09DRAFT_1104838 [Mycena vulgaris]|nr:hypothetical protein DFH09DRAFT_1104838 [Mycena vulgaris]